MKITKVSPRTGQLNTLDLPMTAEQYDQWRIGPGLIQDMLPELTAEQREFLLTGYTPEDWEILFPPEDDDV
jgi:hypothetical protein